MFKVLIEGFNTKAEAEEFINWYSGQGEQDADIWFECRKSDGDIEVDSMHVDCGKTFPLACNDDIIKMVIKPR